MKENSRTALREEAKRHLSEEQIKTLGIDLPAGNLHYRAYVGPPEKYDLLGALQFQVLTNLGLREYHKLLEVGCGSLRVGRLLVPYLIDGNYYAIEPKILS